MNPRVLVVPLALAAGLFAMAVPPEACATCTVNVVEVPNRVFTLVSFQVDTQDTGTPAPSAAEAGWLDSFEQSADAAFGSPGVLYANSLGALTIEMGPPEDPTGTTTGDTGSLP